MDTIALAQLKSNATKVFKSIIVFCPHFPPAAQTTTAKKFDQLTGIIDSVLERASSDDARQRLRICLDEVRQSRKHYEDGDRKSGMEVMQRAEEHFKESFAKKLKKARFVVGQSGPALDKDAGFPQ